jgi:nicotinamide-nucleotide amidase
MKAEIISVGTELLLGFIVDTNANWLATELSLLGIHCYHISQVGDNRARLADLITLASKRADVVVISGGLGPTEDDLTREAICDWLQEEPTVNEQTLEGIRQVFNRRRLPMPDNNQKQAWVVPSAQLLINPIGTAPGWWVEKNGKTIVAMPGVPSEMKRMFTEQVVPRLKQQQTSTQQSVLVHRIFKVLGMSESAIEMAIQAYLACPNPSIATYAKQDGIHVRTSATAATQAQAQDLLDQLESNIRSALGHHIYAIEPQTLTQSIEKLLFEKYPNTRLFAIDLGTAGALPAALSAFGNTCSGCLSLAGLPEETTDLNEYTQHLLTQMDSQLNLTQSKVEWLLSACVQEASEQGEKPQSIWKSAASWWHIPSNRHIHIKRIDTCDRALAGQRLAMDSLNQLRLFLQGD